MTDRFGDDLLEMLPRLRRFALSLTRSADISDDLVQITCQKALSGRDGFKPGTRFDAWLFRILRNTWIDMARQQGTRGPAVDLDTAGEIQGVDGASETEHRLMLRRTLAAIEDLPDEQREVLLLVCVEELSYRETADVLDVAMGTVMSRLARARRKLAEDLGINAAPGRS